MELIIHCYGYSELMFQTLNALAMFRNADFYHIVINTMVLMVGTFYAWKISSSGASGQWKQYLLQCIGMIVFVNSLMMPKTTMYIKDHVEKSFKKVDNIPLAFALPVGTVESFGHIITMGFEQAFAFVGGRSSHSYYHYGTVFGARLSKEVLEAKIRDPEVASNMRKFIERCVILPSMIGIKFTKEELVATTNIWGLVSKHAGDLSRVNMIINGARDSKTCKQAVVYFEGKFLDVNKGLIATLSQKFRGAGNTLGYNSEVRQLNNNLKIAIGGLYNNTHSVDSILKNNMMINSINSYRSGKYATARAQMHQEASGLLSGDLAEKTLTGSLALMKVILYSSFIFLLPILILSGGFSIYKRWITAAFSLALWPPLFSILNMVIDVAYDPAKLVSYSTWSTEKEKFDSIASLAAGLSIMIPVIAYQMTSLAAGGVAQIAGYAMSGVQAATNAIAGEKSSGSRGWDNESINNSSRDNSNSYKSNHNREYVSGEQSWTNKDGSRTKVTGSGKQVITSGAGITSDVGETRYTMDDSNRAEVSQGAAQSAENLAAKSASYSSAKSNTLNESKDWLKSIAQRHGTNNAVNYEEMGEQGKSVQQMASTAQTLVKDYGYNWQQAVEGAVSGSISASTPGKFLGFGATVSADGKISANNNSTQQFSEKEQMERNTHASESYNNLIKAAQSQNASEDKSIDKSQSERITSSWEEQQSFREELSKARHESEAWHEAQNIINSSGGASSRDMTGELTERYMKDSGINDRHLAHQHVSKRTPEVMRSWNKMVSEDSFVQNLVSDIAANKAKMSPENSDKEFNEFNKTHAIERGAYNKQVDQAATSDGFKQEEIKRSVMLQKEDLSGKFENITEDNNILYQNDKQDILAKEQQQQTIIDQFEKRRPKLESSIFGSIGGPTNDLVIPEINNNRSFENAKSSKNKDLNNDDLIKPYNGNGNKIKLTTISSPNKKF